MKFYKVLISARKYDRTKMIEARKNYVVIVCNTRVVSSTRMCAQRKRCVIVASR